MLCVIMGKAKCRVFFLDGEVNKPSGLAVSITKEKQRERYGGVRYGKREKREKKTGKW